MTGLATPALVVDAAALDANLAAMQARCAAAGVALRPHVKGHKCAWIAGRQLAAGATGLAAATVEEAAGLLTAGHGRDVLVTSVLPPRALSDVAALRALGDVAIVADRPELVEATAAAARAAGVTLRVLADVDVGQHRGGAQVAATAVAVARAAAAGDGVAYAGVQAYEGHLQLLGADARAAGHRAAMDGLRCVLGALAAAGLPAPLVTSAGTGTAALAFARDTPVTEVQPGSYALMDASYAPATGGFAHAVHVHTAVRSVLGPDAVVVDAGLKAVSIDMGNAGVAERDATWEPAGDEHGIVRGDVAGLEPGSIVRLVPSHTDTTVRLHRRLWVDAVASVALF